MAAIEATEAYLKIEPEQIQAELVRQDLEIDRRELMRLTNSRNRKR